MTNEDLKRLRRVINENLRVQRGGADPVPYIDVLNALGDVAARQNHAIFARRGFGKTLLLHHSASLLPPEIRHVYLNCEDFKRHSFPNVLIEILDALFAELERNLTGWFGKKRKSRQLIAEIRLELHALKKKADFQEREVRVVDSSESKSGLGAELGSENAGAKVTAELGELRKTETEQRYRQNEDKIRELDAWLPSLKQRIREFLELSMAVKSVFLQVDDLYHLPRPDQPFVMDYIHRLCKDVPVYFKVATLRHASTLYAERKGQPIGAQERHDYQPVNVDFTFTSFERTVVQNRKILHEFGRLAGLESFTIDALFKGQGFERLVLAGGGVPRDFLSLFLEVLESVQPPAGDGRIGKDEVRIHSRANFERRIEELKQDSEGQEQGLLIKGIYVLRQFCIEKKTNVVLVSEALLQQDDRVRDLLYRLLDYRIIHTAGSALTHKSQAGTYHAFAIDYGCYAHMRILDKRFNEVDLAEPQAREKMRSAPTLDRALFDALWANAPADSESALKVQETGEAECGNSSEQ